MPYKNIPVEEDVYEDVQRIAGKRGMGAQVKAWVDRELATCEHEKIPVTVEYFSGQDILPGQAHIRNGWYCETCRRVYQRLDDEDAVDTKNGKKVKAGQHA